MVLPERSVPYMLTNVACFMLSLLPLRGGKLETSAHLRGTPCQTESIRFGIKLNLRTKKPTPCMRERFPLDPSRTIDKVSSCPFVGIVTALDGSGMRSGKKGLGNSACVTARPATLRMDGAPVDLLHRSRKFLEARQAVIYRNVQK
jgi:hypothetical protein